MNPLVTICMGTVVAISTYTHIHECICHISKFGRTVHTTTPPRGRVVVWSHIYNINGPHVWRQYDQTCASPVIRAGPWKNIVYRYPEPQTTNVRERMVYADPSTMLHQPKGWKFRNESRGVYPNSIKGQRSSTTFPRTWLIAGRILRTLHTTLRVGSCMGTRLTQLASSVMNSGTYCPVVPWKPTNKSTLSITVEVGDVGWGNHESSGHENLSPWMWEIYGERAVARSGDLSLKCPWPHFEPPDHLPP